MLSYCPFLRIARCSTGASSNSLPEGDRLNAPWGSGGRADFPGIVDETNLVNTATNQQAVQPPTSAVAVDSTLVRIAAIWNPFLDPEFNPTINEPESVDFTEPIHLS